MEAEKEMEIGTWTAPFMFLEAVKKCGERVAIRKKELGLWREISWIQYYEQVRFVSSALIRLGLKKGDKAAIAGDNCPEWIFADMAIQCAGAAAVGVYATNAWQQVQYVIEHSDARFYFVENEEQLDKWLRFEDRAPLLEKVIVWEKEGLRNFDHPKVTTFDELVELGRRVAEEEPDLFEKRLLSVAPDDISLLIYTSGTTGPPKGAMLTHGNVVWTARALARDNRIFETDEVLSFLPLCHIFERLFSVFAHLVHRYTVNFVEKPDTVADNMAEISPSVGYAVPRIWEKYYSTIMIRMSDATFFKRLVFNAALNIGLRKADLSMNFKPIPSGLKALYALANFVVFRKLKERLGFDRIRMAYSGAAPISHEVLGFFQAIGVNLVEGYGQTEGTGVTCLTPVGKPRFGSVGPALQGTRIRIAEDGEILVKSPGVFAGYHKDPDATAEAIRDGWLHSGDVGEIDDQGYLAVTDRKKDIIVTAGGKNITPQYIENKLKASIYVNDAVVIGDRRKYLTCLVMIDEDNVVKYAQDNKIQFSTYKDLTMAREIEELIGREIEKVNATLARVENVRKFAILPKKLYEEDGEVTPTMKVKRKIVNEAFADLIEAMYSEKKD